MYGQHMFIVLVGILLAGCKDDNSKAVLDDAISGGDLLNLPKEEEPTPPLDTSSPLEPKPTPIEPNALGNLIEIAILPPEGQLSVPANSKMKLRVTGIYENGTDDLTEQAELRILDDVSNITFTEDNQIQAGAWDSSGAYNDTRIEAEFENIKAELTVKVMEGVCEESLTLAQVEALDGTCVKSYTHDGKEYVFTPRKKFMYELGYSTDNTEENQGRTYSYIQSENFPYALFRRDGKGMNWDNFTQNRNPYGQAERFCNDLAQMSFNNKDHWQIATTEDLVELIAHHKDNNLMYSEGLPLHYFSIWSDERFVNVYGAYRKNVGQVQGASLKIGTPLSDKHAVICRSE
ncbi:hypothetical protein AB4423_17880 [Vibrio chagasii]|uniref:hypothetical protein n=1 Tax=Vibrio chagasii TaxID=170679 RepID=UPI00355125A0